jgi:hypothetical protein
MRTNITPSIKNPKPVTATPFCKRQESCFTCKGNDKCAGYTFFKRMEFKA